MAITITIGTPVGVKTNEVIRFLLTFSVIPDVASVILVRQEDPTSQRATAVIINGTNGVAIFEGGILPSGTYDVHATAATTIDSGYIQGTDLPLALATNPIQTQYQELIRETLQANAAVVDLLRQVGPKKASEHPDIVIDFLGNLDRMAGSPGIMIEPVPGESAFVAFNARSYELAVNVYVTGRANMEGIRNDGDRERLQEIAQAVMNALIANQHLGGFLSKPITFSVIDTVAFRPARLDNATIVTSFFVASATKWKRGAV